LKELEDRKVESFTIEKRDLRKDGTIVWVRRTVSCVRRPDGSIDYFVSVVEDISARKRAEDQVHLLMREANHRVKNILGLVQAIVRQTAPDCFAIVSERIQALSANQDLLVRNEWRGTDVEDLVRTQLAYLADFFESRISVHGQRLHLNAIAAQAIGLALHELATNASKYGALSTAIGHVDIHWQVDGDLFAMNWIERDGPPVRPPMHRGFGTTVIESMAKLAANGEVRLNYAPSGLEWHLSCLAANTLELPSGAT
jgi:two-component sensor histidine kinase